MNRWIATFLIMLAVSAGGGTVAYQFYDAQKQELGLLATRDMARHAEELNSMVSTMFEPAFAIAESVALAGLHDLSLREKVPVFLALTAGTIRHYRAVNGAYLGFADGSFIQVQDLEARVDGGPESTGDEEILTARVIDASRSGDNEQWWIYDPERASWRQDFSRAAAYDPRERPWYLLVQDVGGPALTDPYTFASSGVPGVTFASPMIGPDGAEWAVLGVDFSLDSLSGTVADISDTIVEDAEVVFAADPGMRLYGAFDLEGSHPLMRRSDVIQSVLQREHPLGVVGEVTVGDLTLLTLAAELDAEKGMPLRIFLARDVAGINANATETMRRNLILVVCVILIAAAITSYAYRLWAEVSARKKVEAALIESRDAAEAATRAKSVFLATMSHEIRTPMNGIMSMTELLSVSRLDGEQRDMVKVVGDSARALLAIINDILDFSKIEAGKFDLERISFSLTDIVDGTAELLAPRAHEKGLEFTVGIDPGLVDQRIGDPARLRQILINLGGNAIKFTSEGAVEIIVSRADRSGERLRFDVIDTGIGLSEEALSGLFKPFSQADSSTSRKYGGTGLGLSICYRLVEMMGGAIGADSTPGQGSTFWFELPLSPSDEAPPSPAHDLSSAVIRTIGLSSRETGVAERYLRAGGVRDIEHLEEFPAESDNVADLWLVAARMVTPGDGMLDALSGAVALVGGRAEIAEAVDPPPARPVLQLSAPLVRTALWRATAVALGHEPWESADDHSRPDMDFAPPPRQDAFDANALVLVAEDNETNRLVIRKLLGRLGYACDVAENGRVALDMLQRPGHGFLLTDFNMPEMDGRELTQAVRRAEREQGLDRLPVVALTADAMVGAEAACLEAGMDAFLTKPVDSGKLSAILAEMLPVAAGLRRARATDVSAGRAPDNSVPRWDPDVFDPTILGEPDGTLDAEALELIESAANDWNDKVSDILAALGKGDDAAARRVVHALKGASLSIGATRLGRIASDIQDSLDSGDKDMADLLAAGLQPTLTEFQTIVPRLRGN